MNKKYIAVATICMCLALLSSCTVNEKDTTTTTIPTSVIDNDYSETEDISIIETILELPLLMDGSTSTIPLEAGIKSELMGITYSEALKLVEHTKTHTAFEKLLDSEVDLIFSVPLSEEQEELAKEKDFKIEAIPVAMEGFVFVVNVDNPVDTLTSEQVKQIYSGKITNWKEVGGLDEPIVAYQRNRDSGSQNYMVEFMDGTPLMDVPMELIPGFMGGMMDAISVFDNSRQAIGYSVYSYAAQMYANANQVKFIKVDGIEPSKQTFSDKTYPLLSCTYIFFNKTLPDDSVVRVFTKWLTSREGQTCVLRNGYVPVADMEIPSEYLLYLKSGTGIEKPSDYEPSRLYSETTIDLKTTYAEKKDYIDNMLHQHISDVKLDALTDKELEAEINAWLEQAFNEIAPYSLINTEERSPDVSGMKFIYEYNEESDYVFKTDLHYEVKCINGYLSILIGYLEECPFLTENAYSEISEYSKHFMICRTAVFDLIDGKRIENFSDLFYKDVDFVSIANNNIAKFISNHDEKAYPGAEKISFSGLLGDVEYFTFDKIILAPDNPYFYCAAELSYTGESLKDSSVIWEYRDMTGLFVEETVDENGVPIDIDLETPYYDRISTEFIIERYLNEKDTYFEKITYSRFLSNDEIEKMNADIKTILDVAFEQGFTYPYISFNYKNMYVIDFGRYAFEKRIYFDKDTLEQLFEDDIFIDGWRDAAKYEVGKIPDENDLFIGYYMDGNTYEIYFLHQIDEFSSTSYRVELPFEYINERYK